MFDFLTLKNSVEAIREKHHKLHREREVLRAEINAVRHAPINRADVVELVEQWIQRTQTGFNEAITGRLAQLYRSNQAGPHKAGFLGLVSPAGDQLPVGAVDSLLCAMFSDQLRLAMHAAIERMPQPGEGLKAAERAKKLADLEARNKALTQDIEKIAKDAADAGIDL
ncbi:MAG: hypothetical protein U1E71_10025 [Ramlibacter sp.]|jgi:cell division protein FtsB